jgi:hypothetical protein
VVLEITAIIPVPLKQCPAASCLRGHSKAQVDVPPEDSTDGALPIALPESTQYSSLAATPDQTILSFL